MQIFRLMAILLFCGIVLSSCAGKIIVPRVTIGISKTNENLIYEEYTRWLKSVDTNLDVLNLYAISKDSINEVFNKIDGFILSDSPVIAGISQQSNSVSPSEFNTEKDSFDIELLNIAIKKDIPILAINRGALLVNVVHDGKVKALPLDNKMQKTIHYVSNSDTSHTVQIDKKSLLHFVMKETDGIVYSNHQYYISELSDKLEAMAYSEDGKIEAFTYFNGTFFPYLLAIQWNPEKMKFGNPFSNKIAKSFIERAQYFHSLKKPQKVAESSISFSYYLLIFLLLLLVGSAFNKPSNND